MQGKEKRKKKKGKSRDMSRIAAALMPPVMFAAVPRTPPPPARPPDAPSHVSTALLSSTLLGRLFATPEPTLENVLSDDVSDTSVDDYDGDGPGYSSMDFRGTSTGESMGFRASQPLPGESQSLDGSYDDLSGSPRYASVDVHEAPRPRSASPPGDPLYAQVRKTGRGRRPHYDDDVRSSYESGPGSSSLRRFAEEDERSLRQTGQSPHRSTLRSAHRSRSPSPRSTAHTPSPRQSMEMKLESMVVSKVGRGTSPMSTGEHTSRSADLAHTASQKLRTLEARNMELLTQQQAALQQLEQQQQLQKELMQKLADRELLASQRPGESLRDTDMGSLLQETQSVTETTLNQQNTLILSMQTRTAVLEQEKRELQELNEQLQAEINSLRRLASIKDSDGDGMGTQVLLLKKQLQDFKDERDTLKASVHRLNAELSRFQAKYRTPPPGESEENPGLPTKGPTPSWLINTKYLAPLFMAYDDRLAEKDGLLQDYEGEMDHFRDRVEEIIKENARLHIRLEQTDAAGPISMTEWRQLQEQCRLVLEENQLLMEQLDLQQNKAKDMHKAHVQEVARLSKKLVQAEAERNDFQRRVSEVKDEYDDVKKAHDSAVVDSAVKMGLEDHLSAISQLKLTLQEEKTKYEAQLEELRSKVTSAEVEKRGISVELQDMREENKKLTSELKAMNKSQRKSLRKTLILQRALEEVETKELSTSKYLNTIVKVAEQTAHERDTFAQVAHKQDQQRKRAISKVMHGNLVNVRMEEKLKLVKLKANEKLANMANQLKEKDDDFNQRTSEYEREIKHLRLLLREREDMLENIAGEKRCVEDDLETMWQVASADNRRMRETYRKSVRKLKQHATLDAVISDTEEDKKNLLHLSDDDN